MQEDQVNPETESSEEGPLQETDTQTETTPESSEGTATDAGEPQVVEREKYDEVVSAYDKFKSESQSKEAELQRELEAYRAVEREKIEAQLKDDEAWQQRVSEVGLSNALNERVDKLFQLRMQGMQTQNASVEAANRVKEFAVNEAGMTEQEYGQFLAENVDASGVPFGGYTPAQAERIAKGLLRDRHFDHFAAKAQANADAKAMDKSKKKIASQAPTTASVGGAKEKSPGDEFVDEVMASEKQSEVDKFFSD